MKTYNIFILLIAVLLAAHIAGFYHLEMLSGIAPISLTHSLALLLCALIIGRSVHISARKNDKIIHPEKAIIYRKFIESWYDTADIGSFDLHTSMTLWAENQVLREFMLLEKINGEVKKHAQAERVIKAMRRDLGHRTYYFSPGRIQELIESGKSIKRTTYETETTEKQARTSKRKDLVL